MDRNIRRVWWPSMISTSTTRDEYCYQSQVDAPKEINVTISAAALVEGLQESLEHAALRKRLVKRTLFQVQSTTTTRVKTLSLLSIRCPLGFSGGHETLVAPETPAASEQLSNMVRMHDSRGVVGVRSVE
ncbi:hypothetical protein AC1031_006391 [Aphanomyces cochlioides]|nr:hypothetical protein AC1031_006391 [Aphanomyces cochlioides]